MTKPVHPFILITAATCFALVVLIFFKSFKKISPKTRAVGFYGASVWFTSALLSKLVQFIYRSYFSSWHLARDLRNREFANIDWRFDRMTEYLFSCFISLPVFAFICIILSYFLKTSNQLKTVLTLLVFLFFAKNLFLFFSGPNVNVIPLTERIPYMFIYGCCTILPSIWFFKIKEEDNFKFIRQMPDDILDA